jgi:hypothetical protein
MRLLRSQWPCLAAAIAALVIAVAFVVVVVRHTSFGLPIEDAYIYLTYAKQFGRAEPFTYFSGGGYSAGSTSVIWPMVLAPFWTLGARGGALVWVAFVLCACLYAATGVLCAMLVRRIFGSVTAAVAAGFALGIAPFAFTALSGMEVALASCLLLAGIYQLLDAAPAGPPSKKLAVTLAALSLSRPEATVIVACIVGVHVVHRLRGKDWRAAAWWATPLSPAFAWLVANRVLAGNWFPNTGVAKSHFYLPGFDWTYWWDAVTHQTWEMLRGLFWSGDSPLVWPRLVALLWLAGAVRVLVSARRSGKLLVGALMVFAPLGLMVAVIASSGAWKFHNYRYIACAFPLLVSVAACALAPWRIPDRFRWAHPAGAGVLMLLFARAGCEPMRADMDLYAQNATDLNTQVVTLGRYIHEHIPDAYVMFHDAGAIAYYGDTRVFDMLGLVTNRQARIANNGPGSRFEFLESLPAAERPTHFAYYPSWMGQAEFYGDVLVRTPLAPAFHGRRLIGDRDMQLIVARWDRVHTAEQPLALDPGWRVVDRIDVADIASEDAHAWAGGLGRRHFGDPTARWSVFHKDELGARPLLDGGRTIRGGWERFTISVDPTRPVRLVMRTGGRRAYPYHDAIPGPVAIGLYDDAGTPLARATLPAPSGAFVEVVFEVRATRSSLHVVTQALAPYRVFHWFVLQPDPSTPAPR